MAKRKLDLPFVKSVQPTDKRETYFDTSLPCFALRVFPTGAKSFIIKYRNKYDQQRFHKIGSFPTMTLEKARERARELLQDIELGGDPAKQKQEDKDVLTVSELCELYLEKGLGEKKASTVMNDKSRIERHIKPLIGNEPIRTLTRGQVEDMMQDIAKGKKIATSIKGDKPRSKITIRGGRDAATRTTQLLGAILQFGVRRELLDKNPAYGIKKPKSNTRDIYLTLDDVRTLGRALNSSAVQTTYKAAADAIKLLLMTGCRKSEILSLRWEYIDFQNQVFRFPDTKTGKQNRPFGLGALNLLRELERNKKSDWVFPSTIDSTKHMTALLRTFKTIQETKDDSDNQIFTKQQVGLHTLRHSFSSIAHNELNYSKLTRSGLLGHRKGNDVTERYTHLPDESQIHAANRLSLLISSALNDTTHTGKIINISKVA